jgi:hypothetical protein
MNQTERLLNAAMDHIASTLEQPSDLRAWEQLLIYCPSALLLERAAKYTPVPEQDIGCGKSVIEPWNAPEQEK